MASNLQFGYSYENVSFYQLLHGAERTAVHSSRFMLFLFFNLSRSSVYHVRGKTWPHVAVWFGWPRCLSCAAIQEQLAQHLQWLPCGENPTSAKMSTHARPTSLRLIITLPLCGLDIKFIKASPTCTQRYTLLMGIDDNCCDKNFGTHLVPISFVLQQRADNLYVFVFQHRSG